MSKTWYPVINGESCIECGACINKCTHKVYNKALAPRPVVVFPEGCIHGCHGCAVLCPSEAISYFGDTETKADGGSCCG